MEGVRFAGQFPVEGLLCSPCRMAPPEFERAVAYAVYQDELREMVHLLKYERMSAVARPLGRMLARAIEMIEAEAGRDLLVVAVPLFPSKERQRGYNQAVLISDAALVELKKRRPEWRLRAAHGVIRRVKDTRSQFELTPKGRRRNLQGALPEMLAQLRSAPEDLPATFKLYRNLDALYDVLGNVVESAGAFGSKDDFQALSNELSNFEGTRKALAERIGNLASSKENEINRLRADLKAAQAALPSAQPKKIVVDDNEAPKKPAVKKKPAKKPAITPLPGQGQTPPASAPH